MLNFAYLIIVESSDKNKFFDVGEIFSTFVFEKRSRIVFPKCNLNRQKCYSYNYIQTFLQIYLLVLMLMLRFKATELFLSRLGLPLQRDKLIYFAFSTSILLPLQRIRLHIKI